MATVYKTWGPAGSGADYTSDATLETALSDGVTFAGADLHLLLFAGATVTLTANRTWTLTNLSSLTVEMLGWQTEQANNRFYWWDGPLPTIDGGVGGTWFLNPKYDAITVTFQHIELRNILVTPTEITAVTGGGPFQALNCRGIQLQGLYYGGWVLRQSSLAAQTVLVENFVGTSVAAGQLDAAGLISLAASDTAFIARHCSIRIDGMNGSGGNGAYCYRNITCHDCIGVAENGIGTSTGFFQCVGDNNISIDTSIPTGNNNQASVAVGNIWTNPNYYMGTNTVDSGRIYVRPDFTVKPGGVADSTGKVVGATTDFGGNTFGATPNVGALASPTDTDPSAASVIAAAAVGYTGILGRNMFDRQNEYDSRLLAYDDARARNWFTSYGGFGGPMGGLNKAGKPMLFAINGGHTLNVFRNVGGMSDDRSVKNMTAGRLPPIFRTLTPTGDVTNGTNVVTNVSSMANIYAGAFLYPVTGIAGIRHVVAPITGNSFTFDGVAATATNVGLALSIREYDFETDWGRGHSYHNGNICTVTMEDGSTARCLFYMATASGWDGAANTDSTHPLLFNMDTKSYIEPGATNNTEVFPASFGQAGICAVVEDPNGTLLHIYSYSGLAYSTFDGSKKASQGRMTAVAQFVGSTGSDPAGNAYAAGSCFADSAASLLFTSSGLSANGKLQRFRLDTYAISEITITPTDGNTIPTLTNTRYIGPERNPRNANQFFYVDGQNGYYTLDLNAGTFTSTKTVITRTGQNANAFPTYVVNDGAENYKLGKPLDVPSGGLVLFHAGGGSNAMLFTKLAAAVSGGVFGSYFYRQVAGGNF